MPPADTEQFSVGNASAVVSWHLVCAAQAAHAKADHTPTHVLVEDPAIPLGADGEKPGEQLLRGTFPALPPTEAHCSMSLVSATHSSRPLPSVCLSSVLSCDTRVLGSQCHADPAPCLHPSGLLVSPLATSMEEWPARPADSRRCRLCLAMAGPRGGFILACTLC